MHASNIIKQHSSKNFKEIQLSLSAHLKKKVEEIISKNSEMIIEKYVKQQMREITERLQKKIKNYVKMETLSLEFDTLGKIKKFQTSLGKGENDYKKHPRRQRSLRIPRNNYKFRKMPKKAIHSKAYGYKRMNQYNFEKPQDRGINRKRRMSYDF